jgi:two-component system nitrate/nitrite response regulator NarL
VKVSTSVLVADDHGVARLGVRVALEADGGFRVVAEAESGSEVLPLVERHAPDLVLLDLRLPGLSGFGCLELLRRRHPDVAVVVLSVSESREDVREAIRRGARGYIAKSIDPAQLGDALRHALAGTVVEPEDGLEPAAGDLRLTARETSILRGVARGLTNRAIAQELWVTEQTVKFHLTNVYRKLGASNRTMAARRALSLGIADDPGA